MRTRYALLLAIYIIIGVASVRAAAPLSGDDNAVAADVLVSRSLPLGTAWADSTYAVSIVYPEFTPLTTADLERYQSLLTDSLGALPAIESHIVVDRKRGYMEVSFVPIALRDGRYVWLTDFDLELTATPKAAAATSSTSTTSSSSPTTRSSDAAARYADHSVLASGSWAKIRVSESGVYQLTEALVRKAGFSSLSNVKVYGYGGALQDEALGGDYLAATDDLHEVATCTVGGKRLFWAQGPVSWSSNTATKRTRNPYSNYGYYFLTENTAEPLTVDSTTFIDSFYPSPDYYHTLHEVDNYAWYEGGCNLFEDSAVSVGSSKTYTLSLISGQAGEGRLSVGLSAGTASVTRIAINDSIVGTMRITLGSYDNGNEVEATYRMTSLQAVNTVTLTPMSGGPVRLDYISAYQTQALPSRPTLTGSFSTPEYVYNITNQDLHADSNIDMVIIVPASGKLTTQAERLAAMHRTVDGMTVKVVPADELYNEFSSGTPDVNAYRRYLKMLYDRATTDSELPTHLLLFGDCVWDNRLLTADCSSLSADDLLLCYESENSFSITECYINDGFFCNLDDGEGDSPKTDKGDIAVGRFPVRTAAEAKIMVDKTLAYVANENAGSWQNVIMFMGDDGNENQHMDDADMLASLVEEMNPTLYVKRVMWDAYARESSSTGYSYPDVTKVITAQQNAGALVMNYSGHGRADMISHEGVLKIADFEAFTNTNLPLWITASCDIMPFDTQQETIGETAVLNENGGAVAFFGTTRTVYVDRNRAMNKAYIEALLTPVDSVYNTIGEAQRLAKNSLITTGTDVTLNKLQYSLLGDPAIRLNVPTHAAVIDSINGVAVTSAAELPALKAGSIASVKGHINIIGTESLDTNFNGTMTAVVRDAEKTVTCRLNDTGSDGASEAFVYTDRDNVLYNGSNTVTGGEFEFSFAVPMDIDYSNESGLINIFAVNTTTLETVNGYNEDFTVGGTETVQNDSIGPSVYCYLNSTSFVNGGNVNTTPYFVAEIMDQDGVNASGSGIGHNMILTIDNDATKSYDLTDNFTFDFGSYTQGTTYYSIPALDEGKHTLSFRAWDVLNNSSTTELTFNVVSGLRPGTLDVSLTDNPAFTTTTFTITHDRAGSNIDIEIDVFDVSGRVVWNHSESGTSTSSSYTVEWDLTNSYGARLGTGIYICRVRVSSDGSGPLAKNQKLVIVKR